MTEKTIGEHAKEYEPTRMKTIADVEAVSIKQVFHKDEERKTQDGEKYKVSYVTVDGEEYRVPNSVIEQLQTFMEEKPEMTTFKVTKKGEGKGTKYTVIPLD